MNTTDKPNPELKGVFNGNCNRTACQKPDATFFNFSTRAYYCTECANTINKMNPESFELFGHELCIHQDTPYDKNTP